MFLKSNIISSFSLPLTKVSLLSLFCFFVNLLPFCWNLKPVYSWLHVLPQSLGQFVGPPQEFFPTSDLERMIDKKVIPERDIGIQTALPHLIITKLILLLILILLK